MIRASVLILVLLAMLSVRQAQSGDLTTKIGPGEILRGRFVQERVLTGFATPLRSEGHFVLVPGRGLIWRVEKPHRIVTTITSAGLSQSVDGGGVVRLPAARLPFLGPLYEMLSGALAGDWQSLEPRFILRRSGDDQRWRIELTPRQTNDRNMLVRLVNLAGRRFVDEVELVKPAGDVDRLRFLDQALSDTPLAAEEIALLDGAGK